MLIVPKPDALTQPYWDGVSQHELRIQKCRGCGHVWHPPLYLCPRCHSADVEWIAASGRATLYSYTVVHHAAHLAVADRVPYLVALATLQEGPRVVCNLLNCERAEVRIGMPLRLTFQQIAPGVWLPQFQPAAGEGDDAGREGGLLAGIRVLDIGTLLAGPGAATLLADHGAEVIKVERPDGGDTMRHFGPFCEGESLTFAVEGRNKKSVTLDLHTSEGQEILRRLASQCDAVIENFRPGTLAQWGLGYQDLRAVNPGVVLLSVTGFGQTGPNASRPGYDRIALAFSGLLNITGFPDRPPVRFGTAIADYATALTGAFAVMSALYHRDALGGVGQHIDLAMYEALFKFSDVMVTAQDRIGLKRERMGNLFFGAAPGDHFRTQSGRYVALSVASDAMFARLCGAIGRPDCVADARFVSHSSRFAHIDDVNGIVADWMLAHPDAEVTAALERAEVPFSLIYNVDDILADAHYAARGSIASVEHPTLGTLRMPGVVPRFLGVPQQPIQPAPSLGAHTDEVLQELLGMTVTQREQLRSAGVI